MKRVYLCLHVSLSLSLCLCLCLSVYLSESIHLWQNQGVPWRLESREECYFKPILLGLQRTRFNGNL